MRAIALLAVAVLLSACAAKPQPTTRVILLPQEDGTPSSVVVNAGNASQTLATPYQQADATAGQAPQISQANQQAVRQRYQPLFEATPPRSARFVVFFQTGGTQLTPASQAEMANVLTETLARSGAEILIIGHTDTTGTPDANDALALRRASQVKEMFVARGFAANRIEAAGRGERELAVATRNNVDEPRNRRVEIVVR